MITRAQIVAEARAWIGTPWRHQRYHKGIGCDCIGLIGGVALALGIDGAEAWRDTPAFHDYGRQPDPALLLSGCALLLDAIGRDDARAGDVLVLRFEHEPQHFAIRTADDPPYMIHALAQARRVAENRINDVWRARIIAAFRFRGIA